MKKIALALALLLLCLTFVGCATSSYANDVSAHSVAEAALDALDPQTDYMDGTNTYYSFYFVDRDEAALINDRVMLYHPNETNVNEICVFRTAREKDARALSDAVEYYIEEQVDYLSGFAKNYSPEDMKKIENADVEVIGCYVIGYILSPEDEAVALNAVRQAIAAK